MTDVGSVGGGGVVVPGWVKTHLMVKVGEDSEGEERPQVRVVGEENSTTQSMVVREAGMEAVHIHIHTSPHSGTGSCNRILEWDLVTRRHRHKRRRGDEAGDDEPPLAKHRRFAVVTRRRVVVALVVVLRRYSPRLAAAHP